MYEEKAFQISVLGKAITALVTVLDAGVNVLIVGGELTHVGAVSCKSPQEELQTIVRPHHREEQISEKWALALSRRLNTAVSVSVGIHYDRINRCQIDEILKASDQLLEEVLAYLKTAMASDRSN